MHVNTVVLALVTYLQATPLVGLTRASPTSLGANMTLTDNSTLSQTHSNRTRRSTAADDYDEAILDSEMEEDEIYNSTEPGVYLGSWCKDTCSSELDHVYCDPKTKICTCEKKYPVRIGKTKGCAMPEALGDQCFYAHTCAYYDSNAICTQIGHKAICACKPGFHTVAVQKGIKRAFCSEDVVVLHTDLPSLLVVASGIAVLSGLLCFVLKLFSSNRYGQPGRYADANIAPPLLFSSDNQWINGIPLTVHGRPSSRTSSQRSTSNLAHYRSKGVLVPASRAGAARAAAILLIPCHLQNARTPPCPEPAPSHQDEIETPAGSRRASISSIHSNASSHMSYSQRRFEMENQMREQRAVMRAARDEAARGSAVVPPTPSPMSTDHLLPSCEELNENENLGIVSSALSITSASAASLGEPAIVKHVAITSNPFKS